MLQVLLAIAVPVGVLFALANIANGAYGLALVELCLSVLALVLWKPMKTVKNPQLVVLAVIFPLFGIVCYVIFLPTSSITVLAWVYTIPVLAYSALGARNGFFVSMFFYLAVGVHLVLRFGPDVAYHDPKAVLNIVLCSGAVWAFVHAYEKARDKSQRMLADMAATDPLTGLRNRLELGSVFERRCEDSQAEGLTMGVIMVDLDLFKVVNDTHGHEGGDEVLRRVAIALTKAVRTEDCVFRMGGEEFCLVVPRMGKKQLRRTAEAIRRRIQRLDIVMNGTRIRVTGSLGAVMMSEQYSSLPEMLDEADRRLYAAKHRGRNTAVCESVKASPRAKKSLTASAGSEAV